MPFEFKLPEVSEGVESVDVAEILVAEGDVVAAGQDICVVETDKAVTEIPCPWAGTITKVHVNPGDTVAIGGVLVTMLLESDQDDASVDSAPAAVSEEKKDAAPAIPKPAVPSTVPVELTGPVGKIEVCLPDVSEGVESVDIAEILVAVGDTVTQGQDICVVETDKAVTEIPCPQGGTVTDVHVSTGQSIGVGALLLTIQGSTAATGTTPAPSSSPSVPAEPTEAPTEVKAAAPAVDAAPKEKTSRTPSPAGPATRRFARKLGVDLGSLQGTGSGGRITIEDVEAWVRERIENTQGGGGPITTPPLPDFSKWGPVETQSRSKLARTSAENMSAAWLTIPHVTQHDLADVTELETARKRYIKSHPDSPKVTMTAIMIKAVVGALKAFPHFNASLSENGQELILKNYYHIGVAVDTPAGLVVPVIRDCDQKNVLEVASELTDLAVRARDRKLKLEEMQGGTFTITNLGGIGGTAFTPIVNWPEVAILGMSRGRGEIRVEDGEIVERLMLPLSLSYDHRVINGADAARFIVRLSSSLSSFFELF